MTVIILDDLIEELVELGVSVMRSGVDTNARILICNSGENAHLERNALSAGLVFVLLPDFLGQADFALRFRSFLKELIEVDKVLWPLVSLVEREL